MDNTKDLLEYNTRRPLLVISEYGRTIQKMIDVACSIPDRATRSDFAGGIVKIMSQLAPQQGEEDEWLHKLYDHLHIMSDYKLDIDSPYPMPKKDTLFKRKKEAIPYPPKRGYIRHYGRILQEMFVKAASYPDGPEKDALLRLLIMQLKRDFITWNESSLTGEDSIADQLTLLSKGLITYSDNLQVSFNPPAPAYGKLNKKGPRRGKPSHGHGHGGSHSRNNGHGRSQHYKKKG